MGSFGEALGGTLGAILRATWAHLGSSLAHFGRPPPARPRSGEALGQSRGDFCTTFRHFVSKVVFSFETSSFLNLNFEDVSNENATFETKCRKVVQKSPLDWPRASPDHPGLIFLHYLPSLCFKNGVFAWRVCIWIGTQMHTLHAKTPFLKQSVGR